MRFQIEADVAFQNPTRIGEIQATLEQMDLPFSLVIFKLNICSWGRWL